MDGYEETAAVAAAVGPTLPTIPTPAKAFEPAAAPLGGGKRPGQGPPPPAATIVIHPTGKPLSLTSNPNGNERYLRTYYPPIPLH